MEREAARQSQSEHRESSNGSQSSSASDPAPSSSSAPSPVTPTPPRLTPNPLLLDCPSAPLPTPTTCSPPPPLTPAPSLSSSHVTKTATPTSPHLLVPAPPKLTSTATPALRTYARPILPSPAKTQTAAAAAATAAASTAATTPAAPTTNTTTSSSSTASLSTKTSNTLTNGSTRTVATTTSTPITPFHTPASPPGRQVSQSLPVGTPGLARANQSAAPVRQRVSQQTLLLGKGLKGTGQDQVLLRAQMLQSLTLRPPPPGALTIPPSLRLKPPTSTSVTAAAAAPPLLSRPQTPLFPPLRPRPVTTTTESATTTASRHLSVPPPTLYSPVRAVPLRPRLLSPNGHRSPSPKQPLHPIAAAAPSSTGPSSINRPISGIKTCPLSPTLLAPGQPPTSSPCFERSPSAARQLQIIALSSGRQLQTAAGAPPQKMRANSESQTVLPLSPTLPKMSAPLPSPMTQKVDVKEKLKQESHEDRTAAKDLKVGTVDQREREKSKVVIEKEDSIEAKKPRREEKDEVMDVTEQGQSGQKMEEEKKMVDVGTEVTDQSKKGQNPEGPKDSNNETKPRISEPIALTTAVKSSPLPAQNTSSESIPAPLPLAVPVRPQIAPPPSLSTAAAATVAVPAVQNSSPVPSAVPVTSPVSVPVQEVTPNQSNQKFAELHSTNQDDNVSIQSDNQSALSSLSSQSPPSSPFVSPSADPPLPPLPPLPPPQPERPTDLRLNHKQPDQTQNNSQHREPDARPEPPNQSEDEEAEGFDQSESGHWEPRAWPEGQQVLTHLVEGFVIQEGLTPFPVNRSSLLVPEQVPKPQEVNGTNGSAALPVAPETRKPTEHSTDSEEEEEGRDTDDPNSRPSQRDRAVLHCQFCGKRGHAHNFMRSKRFCSTSCARGFNVRLTKRLRALSAGSRPERPRPVLNRAESVPGKPLLLRLPRDLWSAGRRDKEVKDKPPAAAAAAAAEEEDMELEAGPEEDDEDDGPEEEEDEDEEDDEEEEEDEPAVSMTTTPNNNNNNTVARTTTESVALHRPRRASAPAVTTTTPTTTFKPAPSQWSVEEVTAFINTLPGCGDIAEAFRVQEIDGQALLLLTEDHLMSSMNIKLGPALKICAHINTLKNP